MPTPPHPTDPNGTLLALDWGTVRIGVAISDPGRTLAAPYDTWPAKPREEVLSRLERVVREEDVQGLVVGLPVNMDGSEGNSAKAAREFARDVGESTGLPVELVDERLTSFEAEQTLRSIGRKPSKDKGRVDRVAATLLLQEVLNRRRT